MKKKLKEWIGRYLPAEIISTILSVSSAWFVKSYFNEAVLAAFVGSLMASVGFYGTMAFRDISKALEHHRKHQMKYGIISFLKDFRNLLVEFGPAEIIDVVIVRPFLMYSAPQFTDSFLLGTFIGKMSADVVFYVFAVIMYEVRKKHLS